MHDPTIDEATGLLQYPYVIERGERLAVGAHGAGAASSEHVLETREPLLIVENIDAEAERYGSSVIAGELAEVGFCSSRSSAAARRRA